MSELVISNAVAFRRSDCPLLPVESWRRVVLDADDFVVDHNRINIADKDQEPD